jgi:hypothetical protein
LSYILVLELLQLHLDTGEQLASAVGVLGEEVLAMGQVEGEGQELGLDVAVEVVGHIAAHGFLDRHQALGEFPGGGGWVVTGRWDWGHALRGGVRLARAESLLEQKGQVAEI